MVNVHWTVDLRRRIRSVRLRTSQVAGSRHRDREINVAKLRVTDGVTPSSHRGAAFPSSPRCGTKQPVPSTPWTADARTHTQHDRRTRTIKVIPTRWKSLGVYVFLPKVPRVCHGHHHHHRPVVRRPKSTQVWCMAYVLPQLYGVGGATGVCVRGDGICRYYASIRPCKPLTKVLGGLIKYIHILTG